MGIAISRASTTGLDTIVIVVAIAICGAMAYASGNIADKKGYSFIAFVLLGLFLPIVGLIVSAALPDRRFQQAMIDATRRNEASSNADSLLKCKMLLDQGAITQEEYDAMKQSILDGSTSSVAIDEDNPVSIEVIHLKNGKISVILIDDGVRTQYHGSWDNTHNRNKEDLTKEIATEIQNETRRKVFYTMVVK